MNVFGSLLNKAYTVKHIAYNKLLWDGNLSHDFILQTINYKIIKYLISNTVNTKKNITLYGKASVNFGIKHSL